MLECVVKTAESTIVNGKKKERKMRRSSADVTAITNREKNIKMKNHEDSVSGPFDIRQNHGLVV